MNRSALSILAILPLLAVSSGERGFGPGDQKWGHVQIRDGVNSFWWLYHTTAPVHSYYLKPLIIWVGSRPDVSPTAYENFMEIGLLDRNLTTRLDSWVTNYNVLFIDNPANLGFSKVKNTNSINWDSVSLAQDMLKVIASVFEKVPQLTVVPSYIVSEGYGTKIAVELASMWYGNQTQKLIPSNLRGIALGDPWISPIDNVAYWASYLRDMGVVDEDGYEKINAETEKIVKNIKAECWSNATIQMESTMKIIKMKAQGIDFRNIVTPVKATRDTDRDEREFKALQNIMNKVRSTLQIKEDHKVHENRNWNGLQQHVMKPATTTVENLLSKTDLVVLIYNGQFDPVVSNPSTEAWVRKLRWNGIKEWLRAPRVAMLVDDIVEGYFKTYDKLKLYWVNRAGQEVQRDNPHAMERILDDLTDRCLCTCPSRYSPLSTFNV